MPGINRQPPNPNLPDAAARISPGEQRQINDRLLDAVAGNQVDLVMDSIASGAEINDTAQGYAALHHVLSNVRHFESDAVVRTLVACGAAVNLPDCDGTTPLHFAAEQGLADITYLLVQRGASVTTLDAEGMCARDIAVRKWGEARENVTEREHYEEVIAVLEGRYVDVSGPRSDPSRPRPNSHKDSSQGRGRGSSN